MAIPYKDWLPQAEKLKQGVTKRVGHECGSGDVLVIEHNKEGYRTWCHRCHEGGFKPHGRRSLDKQLKAWEERNAILYKPWDITLPSDLSETMPSCAALWLARGGITVDLQRKYEIGYSGHYGRVILPVYSGGTLVYYQARAVHPDQQPKYINPAVDKGPIRFVAGESNGIKAVVTEDILSALRVGEIAGTQGIALLGTSPSVSDINCLRRYDTIGAWFDPDKAGIKCTRELTKKLGLLGKTVTPIRTDKDPKEYSTREIKEILQCQLT